MTKTQLSILRLKRGQPVGFRSKSGVIKPFGHINSLPKVVQAKLKKK